MRALITRPLHDARRTARLLEERGVEAVIEPLFSISYIPAASVSLDGVQGYLVTSANGVRALAQALPPDNPLTRDLAVYAVGDATAEAARDHGFSQVYSAGGDVASLAELVRAKARPEAGTLVHAAGTEVAGDLNGDLSASGFTVRRERLYETRSAVALSQETQRLIATKAIQAALFYSPRTAVAFAALAQRANLADACGDIRAYCLSQAVAKELEALPFAAVRVAAEPNQEALLALLDDDRAAGALPNDRVTGATADAEGESVMTDRPGKDAKETEDKTKAEAAKGPDTKGAKETDPKPAGTGTGAASTAGTADAKRAGGVGSVPPATATVGSTTGTAGGGGKPPASSGPGTGPTGGSSSTPAAGRKKGGGGKAIVAVLAVLVIAVLIAFATLPWWRDSSPEPLRSWLPAPPQESARVAELAQQNEALRSDVQALRQRLEQVTDQLGSLEGQVAQGPQGVPEDLQQTIQQLESQVETLLQGMDPEALQAMAQAGDAVQQRVQELAARVDELRRGSADAQTVLAMQERLQQVADLARQTASRQDQALGLLLTTAQLRQAVDQGNPFATELRTVRAIAESMPNVTLDAPVLTDFADAGIPTREMLAERFDRLGTEIIRSAAAPDDAPEWVQSTVRRAMGLVTVRRTDGEAVGDAPSAIVARAASAIEAGDLQTAVQELQKLEGEEAVVADDWLTAAQARLAAEEQLSDLTSEALARFAASQRGGEGGAQQNQAATGTGG